MKTIDTSNIKRPDWKVPKNEQMALDFEKFKKMTVEEAFPCSIHRLANLADRDNQLMRLLNYAATFGVPMGSEEWAVRLICVMRRLKDDDDAQNRFIRQAKAALKNIDGELIQLDASLMHNVKMIEKFTPKEELTCDWCGWKGGRRIGNGSAACADCCPDLVLEKIKSEQQT